MNTWFVLINPVAGGKKGLQRWAKLQPLLEAAQIPFTHVITKDTEHGVHASAEAMRAGYNRFIIIGGDGTANDVINGIMQVEGASLPLICMLPAGTGNDWVRTIGKAKNDKEMIAGLQKAEGKKHDVGVVEYQAGAQRKQKYFINIAGLGFDAHVARRLSMGKGLFNGTKLRYQLAILRSLFIYKHSMVHVRCDGREYDLKTLSIACGICKYNGGGLMQLPEADIADGILDLTIIGSMSKGKMVISLPKLSDGSFTKMQEVKTDTGKEITFTSDTTLFVEADGEFLGEAPVTIKILPAAIQVLHV
ncbi:MAG: diacylglycerol kinase family lipid kinase [Chitinophagales bacterium]